MKAIKFTIKVWLTSVISGLIILLALYLFSGVQDNFGRRILEGLFLISLVCSLPILVLVAISAGLLLKTKLTIRSQKLIIALITTVLIIAAIPVYITTANGSGSLLRMFITPSVFIYALPNWLVAMFGIMFYTLEPAEIRKT